MSHSIAMVEKPKKRKKSSISEEDISIVLQRYAAATVLALLQEVAQVSDAKIDWNALVKRTATGITNAREYQMLWRHLAYCDALVEKLDDGAQPLDDDSDLECELEAFPCVGSEASTEAAACVKVLLASGLPSDSSLPNGSTVEAPLTINIPNGQNNPQIVNSTKGTNIAVPVSVQKQPVGTSAEGLNGNVGASGNLPPRKRRKPWSVAEDNELRAAVQKHGEGNWANISKGDFKSDRTPSQLSQRWTTIKKRDGTLILGGGSHLSEAQLAARQAMCVFLGDDLKGASSVNSAKSSTMKPQNSAQIATEAVSAGVQPQIQSQQDSFKTLASRTGTSSRSGVASKKPVLAPDPIKATAVAAGARIGTPSDAASLVKAAQSKNAVHIMQSAGGSLIKSSMPGSGLLDPHLGPHPSVRNCAGLVATSLTTSSAAPSDTSPTAGIQQVNGHPVKSAAPAFQPSSSSCALASKVLSELQGVSTFGTEVRTGADDFNPIVIDASKELNKNHVADAVNVLREQVEENNAAFSRVVPDQLLQEDQTYVSGHYMKDHGQEDQVFVSGIDRNEQVRQDQITSPKSKQL